MRVGVIPFMLIRNGALGGDRNTKLADTFFDKGKLIPFQYWAAFIKLFARFRQDFTNRTPKAPHFISGMGDFKNKIGPRR